MSIRCDAAEDRLLRTSDLPDYNAAYTVCFWARLVSDLNAISGLFCLNANSGNDIDWLRTTTAGDVIQARVVVGGTATTIAGSTLTIGTWYHFGVVRESANSFKIYLNGVLDITNTQDVTGRTAAVRMEFGGRLNGNFDRADMAVFAIKAWSTNLTEAEIKNEMRTVLPKRLTNIYGRWPCLPGATERLRDYSGNGRNWTESGTLTDEDHPPVSWGARSIFVGLADAAVIEEVSLTLARLHAITTAAEATAEASQALARGLATTAEGGADAEGIATLARSLAVSQAGDATGEGAMALSRSLAAATSAGATSEAATSLARILAILQAGQAATEAATELAMDRAISLTPERLVPADLSLARSLGISQEAAAAALAEVGLNTLRLISLIGEEPGAVIEEAEISLGRSLATSVSGSVAAEAIITLLASLGVTVSGDATAEAGTVLDRDLGFTAAAARDVPATLTLTLDLSTEMAGQAATEAALSLVEQLAINRVAGAAAEAGLNIIITQALALSGSTALISIITPASRTYTVSAESRVYIVPSESRILEAR